MFETLSVAARRLSFRWIGYVCFLVAEVGRSGEPFPSPFVGRGLRRDVGVMGSKTSLAGQHLDPSRPIFVVNPPLLFEVYALF